MSRSSSVADSAVNRSRSLAYLTVACSVALLAPLLRPLLTGRVFVHTDLHWFHLPTRYLYQQAMQSGDTVLWTPAILSGRVHPRRGAGRPLSSVPSTPVSTPSARAGVQSRADRQLPSRCSGEPSGSCDACVSPRAPALFGAMLFAFSGFNLLHHQHINMVAVVAHMPWLLACRRRADRGRAQAGASARVCGHRAASSPPSCCWAFHRACGGTRSRWRPSALFRARRDRALASARAVRVRRRPRASCWAAFSCCPRWTPRRTRRGWG